MAFSVIIPSTTFNIHVEIPIFTSFRQLHLIFILIRFSPIFFSFRQRDRIGVVGPNGVGKSTFLKVLTGSLELAAGNVRLGETARIGYYEQVGAVTGVVIVVDSNCNCN